MNITFDSQINIPIVNKNLEYTSIPHPTIKEILLFNSQDDTSLALAYRQREMARENQGKQILWPTGNTQLDVYKWHRELFRISQDNPIALTFGRHLDEYFPCQPADPHSFVNYIHTQLADPLSLEFEYIKGDAIDPDAEAARYNSLIITKQIAFTTLGTDEKEGHIAFIKPGTPFSQKAVHFTTLSADTINRDHIERKENTPGGAITQGYGMLDAQYIFLIAFGKKGRIIKKALFDNIPDPSIPVSILTLPKYGKKLSIYLDHEAATYL
jgi:6-phosphogluconolactonase/glucosamine-6-phosphate isomerase/deaminase